MAFAAKTSGVCERLRRFLGGLCCEGMVVTLSILSTLAVSGEMLIDYGILTVPKTNSNMETESSPDPSSMEADANTMRTVSQAFHYISLAIAVIFTVEIILKIVVFRMKLLVKPWQVLDILVVMAAIMTEVTFEICGRMKEMEACTFIIFFRLWRIPEACNIKAKAVQYDLLQELEVWKAAKIKMEGKCNMLKEEGKKQKDKIITLEREVSVLKKETQHTKKITKRLSSKRQAPQTPNGYVMYSVNPEARASSLPTNFQNYEPDVTLQIAQIPKYDGCQSSLASEDLLERDTEDEGTEDEYITQTTRSAYCRSGSESSLSYQALEHEVHVQIEGELARQEQDRAAQQIKEQESIDSQGADSATNTPVLHRKKLKSRQERNSYLADPLERNGMKMQYDNPGFEPDDDKIDRPDGSHLLHEIDGTKTYRSAEGIPMTDL